jgi:glycerophosphoryl diester phosphodiesterase
VTRPRLGAIAHPAKGEPYHRVNSLRGIRRAAAQGYQRIDLDLSITKDGVIVVNHWPRLMVRDGFRDPLHQVHPSTPIHRLLWVQVKRLRTLGGYRVVTLLRALRECAAYDLEPVLEPKGDPRFEKVATWAQIHRIAEEAGVDPSVRVLAKNNHHGTVVRLSSVWFDTWEI